MTVADASQRGLPWREVPAYVAAQILGAFAGVAAANTMFSERVFFASRQAREGGAQLFSEFVATFGLLAVIRGCVHFRPATLPFAVGAYITAAYWFTASTSFANPAVTLARSASDTFAGIRPADVPGFIGAQLIGAGAATVLFRWLIPPQPERVAGLGYRGSPGRGQDENRRAIIRHRSAMTHVIFACVHNAGRSQMAAAFFNALADPARAGATSAGTEPADRVHPEVITVMREVGIDLTQARPRRLTDELTAGAQRLITMGCGEACPLVPGLERNDWPIEDPKRQPIERVRAIRDEIRGRVERLIAAEDWAPGRS